MKKKLQAENYDRLYDLALAYHQNTISRQQIFEPRYIEDIVSEGYARNIFHAFDKLIQGEVYKRELSIPVTIFFLKKILNEFGEDHFILAINAVQMHIEYRLHQANKPMNGLKKAIHKLESEIVSNDKDDFTFNNENETTKQFIEGAKKLISVNAYERNIQARKACLEHHGYLCKVCNFDFEKIYGEIGKEFIHVHHVVDLATIGKEYKVDPINDLVPVCPNCHAMLHKRRPVAFTVAELKNILNSSKVPLVQA